MARYSRRKLALFLAKADSESNADRKGAILEDLGRYLFEKVQGISFYAKNILDEDRVHEIDVTFWNAQNVSELGFLEAVVIVECKHTSNPVGSRDVGWFVRKLQDANASFGILIALNGITGASDGRRNAHAEVLRALLRDRIKVLVITRDEILALRSTADLAALLKEKILSLTLRKVVR